MPTPDSDRVYVPGGSVAHLLGRTASPNDSAAEVLCGRTAWPGYWWGTGSQEEYETAADRPVCSSCAAVLTHQAGGVTG